MKKSLLKTVALLLLTVSLFLCDAAVCFAAGEPGEEAEIDDALLVDDDEILTMEELRALATQPGDYDARRPQPDEMYDRPFKLYVKTVHGNSMNIMQKPGKNTHIIGSVNEKDIVTVYAIRQGYYFGVTGEGDMLRCGWFDKDLLSDTYYSGPNPSDTEKLEKDVSRPNRDDYLEDYETMYVSVKKGDKTGLMRKPGSSSKGNTLIFIYDGERVTALAQRGKYYFVCTKDGKMGWLSSKVLVH